MFSSNASNSIISLEELAKRKNLEKQVFQPGDIKFSDDIAKHTAWAFKHIYSIPYPTDAKKEIARFHHGIQHVSRTAFYVPVLANLYRRYGDKAALALTEEDLKLIQIAALFHDAGREHEGIDLWDKESAALLYHYLTSVLGVSAEKANLLANAVADKDSTNEKNIYQKLIHDADCLDIIRVRNQFDAEYLDFYRDIASKNEHAFDEMAQLITEARSLLEIQGDGNWLKKTAIKQRYENENAYHAIESMVNRDYPHPILAALGSHLLDEKCINQPLLPQTSYDKSKGLTAENIQAAMREGKLFSRAIGAPSAIREKLLKNGTQESLAALELRKAARRPGVATQTKKPNNLEKDGNPNRSISLVTPGSQVFSDAGFLLVDPDFKDFKELSASNIDSGTGKKAHLRKQECKYTESEKQQKLAAIIKKQKKGGLAIIGSHGEAQCASEMIYHIRDFDAIYCSTGPNIYNQLNYGSLYCSHEFSPILQALFLQNEYEKCYHKKIPIFHYSPMHNTITKLPEYNTQEIISMWVAMCSAYMQQELANPLQNYPECQLEKATISDIKIASMYKTNKAWKAEQITSADMNYPSELQEAINNALAAEKGKLLKNYTLPTKEQIQQTWINTQAKMCSDYAKGRLAYAKSQNDLGLDVACAGYFDYRTKGENFLYHGMNDNQCISYSKIEKMFHFDDKLFYQIRDKILSERDTLMTLHFQSINQEQIKAAWIKDFDNSMQKTLGRRWMTHCSFQIKKTADALAACRGSYDTIKLDKYISLPLKKEIDVILEREKEITIRDYLIIVLENQIESGLSDFFGEALFILNQLGNHHPKKIIASFWKQALANAKQDMGQGSSSNHAKALIELDNAHLLNENTFLELISEGGDLKITVQKIILRSMQSLQIASVYGLFGANNRHSDESMEPGNTEDSECKMQL